MFLKAIARGTNWVRKVLAGLEPFGESVWPGVITDLYIAHLSIYDFFSNYSKDSQILDAGCGTGYGANLLAKSGANSIIAIDLDPKNIKYCNNHFKIPSITFEIRNLENLNFRPFSIDLVVSSNVLEHLHHPDLFLSGVKTAIRTGGRMLIALPPIISESDLELHSDIDYHRTNLTVQEWITLFENNGWKVKLYRHDYNSPKQLDFTSPFKTKAQLEEFSFEECDYNSLNEQRPITVIYELTNTDTKGSQPKD